MKMLKKFFLAAGLVGLVSSLGFAKEAKAAKPVFEITVDSSSNDVTWTWEDEDAELEWVDEESYAEVLVNDSVVGKLTEDAQDFNLTDLIMDNNPTKEKYDGKPKLRLKLYNGETEKFVTVTSKDAEADAAMRGIYKQTLLKDGKGNGTVTASCSEGDTYTADVAFYGFKDETITLKASESTDSVFVKWSDGGAQTHDVTVSGPATYTATLGLKVQDVDIKAKGPRDASYKGVGDTVELYVGEKLTTDKVLTPANADAYKGSWKVSASGYINSNFVAVKATSAPVEVWYELTNEGETTPMKSGSIFVNIIDNSVKVTTKGKKPDKDEETDFTNYLTTGYEMKFYAYNSADAENMKWVVVEGGDYAEITNQSWSSSNKKQTVTLKGKGDIDAGERKEVKLACTVNGVYAYIDSDDKSVLTKTVYIYSKPSLSYSDRTLKYKAPEKVNTGTSSGKDSNLSDSTESPIDSVKGVKIQVLLDGTSLGFTSSAKEKGSGSSEYTIEASTVENIITNLNNKFTRTCDVEFRTYPCNSDGKFNKNVYKSVTVKVYKVNVIVESASASKSGGTAKAYALPVAAISPVVATGTRTDATATTTAATKEYIYYGLEGQTIDLGSQADASGDKGILTTQFKTLTNGVTDVATTKRIIVSATESLNTYRGSFGTKTATDEAGYDKVPKTGQSNVFVLMMAVVVTAAVCGGLYVYNKKNKENL